MAILGILVPFLAAGGWLWWIYQADRLEREPWWLVRKTFGYGVASGAIGLVLLFSFLFLMPEEQMYWSYTFMVPIHVGALISVLYAVPYRTAEWNDPFDGLVYGGAAGIGYGLIYTLFALIEGPEAGFRTAVFSIPTFMLVGLIIGHYLSQVRFGPRQRTGAMWFRAIAFSTLALAGIELARSLGGDVMGLDYPIASAFVYGANTIGWILAMWAMDAKNRKSQFHPDQRRLALAETLCGACRSQQVIGANFCASCGHSLHTWKGEQQA